VPIIPVCVARQIDAEGDPEPLAEEQYALFSEGSLPATGMVKLSRAAGRGGYDMGKTKAIATAKLNHANEKVIAIADKLVDSYEILIRCPCLNMYEVFGALFVAAIQFAVALIGGGAEENLTTFWDAAARIDIFKDHPVLRESLGQLCFMIAILLFHDGADIFRDKEFFWWLWSSAVSDSSDWLCIDHAFIRSAGTLRLIMKRVTAWIKWNQEILRKGIGPDTGFHGEPLKTSFMCLFCKQIHSPGIFCRSYTWDYKSRMECMGFSMYYLLRFLWECCLAQSPTVKANKPFTCYEFTSNANWTHTVVTTKQLQETDDHEFPPCTLEGYNDELYHRDVMHTKLFGDAKDSLASGAISMVEMNLLGDGTPDEQLHGQTA